MEGSPDLGSSSVDLLPDLKSPHYTTPPSRAVSQVRFLYGLLTYKNIFCRICMYVHDVSLQVFACLAETFHNLSHQTEG
jgi:hypothetical protein